MDSGSQLVDPRWFFIVFGAIVVLLGGFLWWAGMFKRR